MNRTPLDLGLLQAFTAVVDCGSFTGAARRLHSTQSTVSQQLRRLEEHVGASLLDRRRRDIRLTAPGERLLGYARRMLALDAEAVAALSQANVGATLRLGVPEDFASGRITGMLAGFMRAHPEMTLEVTSGLSRELRRLYERGEFDLVLLKQRRDTGEGVSRWPEPLCWVDSASHPSVDGDPLRLVVFPPNGLYRDEMFETVESLGRRWRIGYSSTSLASIQSAVTDGLGISLLPARAVLPGHQVLGPESGFPLIETMEIAIHHRPEAGPLLLELAARLARLVHEPEKARRHR